MKKLLLLLFVLAVVTAPARVSIRGVGDSTMATKKLKGLNPERGWVQMLAPFFAENVHIDNHAANGRSSKSFRAEGRWNVVMDSICPGDYVLIEFGHNDEPGKEGRSTVAGKDFDSNLSRYVRETRKKGGIPVLFTPIARRNFINGTLVDTHGAYTRAVKDVAAKEGVVCIDLDAATTDWLNTLGDSASRRFFMHVEPDIVPLLPDGRVDDTHLNIAGARRVAQMGADSLAAHFPALKALRTPCDIVVAKDGSGDFFTVQEAIDAVPDFHHDTTTVLICEGTYTERVNISPSKTYLRLIGRGNVVIANDVRASSPTFTGDSATGTYGSATVFIFPDNFTAENITFANTAGMNAGQAVAVYTGGDRQFFKKCRFLGFQDTLFAGGEGRQYYEDCYIEGSVDFIFGPAPALFKDCEIRNNRSKGYITAPSTPQGARHGFVFLDCTLTASDGVGQCWLSRPWRDYGSTVFIGCSIGAHIRPEGWHNWRKPEREKTAFYAEYGNTGDGADTSRRAFGHVLGTADGYTPFEILDGWRPASAHF